MRILFIVLFLSSCVRGTEKQVPSILCVADCLDSALYNHDEVTGGAVSELRKMCEDKFEILSCCDTGVYGYFRECMGTSENVYKHSGSNSSGKR